MKLTTFTCIEIEKSSYPKKNSNVPKFLETIVRNDCYCIEYSPMSVESHLHNNNFTLNYSPSAVLFSCNLFIYFNSNPILSTAFMALSYNVFQTVNRLFFQLKDLVLVFTAGAIFFRLFQTFFWLFSDLFFWLILTTYWQNSDFLGKFRLFSDFKVRKKSEKSDQGTSRVFDWNGALLNLNP